MSTSRSSVMRQFISSLFLFLVLLLLLPLLLVLQSNHIRFSQASRVVLASPNSNYNNVDDITVATFGSADHYTALENLIGSVQMHHSVGRATGSESDPLAPWVLVADQGLMEWQRVALCSLDRVQVLRMKTRFHQSVSSYSKSAFLLDLSQFLNAEDAEDQANALVCGMSAGSNRNIQWPSNWWVLDPRMELHAPLSAVLRADMAISPKPLPQDLLLTATTQHSVQVSDLATQHFSAVSFKRPLAAPSKSPADSSHLEAWIVSSFPVLSSDVFAFQVQPGSEESLLTSIWAAAAHCTRRHFQVGDAPALPCVDKEAMDSVVNSVSLDSNEESNVEDLVLGIFAAMLASFDTMGSDALSVVSDDHVQFRCTKMLLDAAALADDEDQQNDPQSADKAVERVLPTSLLLYRRTAADLEAASRGMLEWPFRQWVTPRSELGLAIVLPFVSFQWELVAAFLRRTLGGTSYRACNSQSDTHTAKPVDLWLYYETTDYVMEGHLKQVIQLLPAEQTQCFGRIGFLRANLTKEEDVYPLAASLMFYRLFDGSSSCGKHIRYRYSHFFYMEADAHPIRPDWVSALRNEVYGSTGANALWWMKGSIYRGNKDIGEYRLHINGNALYALNPQFDTFMNIVRKWDSHYAYDVDLVFWMWGRPKRWTKRPREDDAHWPDAQRYWHKFVFSEFVANCWLTGCGTPAQMRVSFPNTIFVHSTQGSSGLMRRNNRDGSSSSGSILTHIFGAVFSSWIGRLFLFVKVSITLRYVYMRKRAGLPLIPESILRRCRRKNPHARLV